jgi:hypothetical protein
MMLDCGVKTHQYLPRQRTGFIAFFFFFFGFIFDRVCHIKRLPAIHPPVWACFRHNLLIWVKQQYMRRVIKGSLSIDMCQSKKYLNFYVCKLTGVPLMGIISIIYYSDLTYYHCEMMNEQINRHIY